VIVRRLGVVDRVEERLREMLLDGIVGRVLRRERPQLVKRGV
jgi:hypothetical protein